MTDIRETEIGRLLIGESLPMRQLKALIARVASSTLPVLIQGETGSGKELVARALHERSGRQGPMVALNICALADTMFEASLFGHVRGAFTGAMGDAAGYLTEAHRGTLFLDEVAGLSAANQMKLLRAVETKEFRPIGGRADHRSDFRLIAASNEEMSRLVASGRFRRDLAHRLSGLRLTVPPLRDRLEDVPLLVAHFALGALTGRPGVAIADGAVRVLQLHSWPGNVRELRHTIEAAIALSGGAVTVDDVTALLRPEPQSGVSSERRYRDDRELLAHLDRCAWDVSEAASALGVHRATIYRRLRRLGLAGTVRVAGADPGSEAGSSSPRLRIS
jgi:DNA-binding NtrC family response regulator